MTGSIGALYIIELCEHIQSLHIKYWHWHITIENCRCVPDFLNSFLRMKSSCLRFRAPSSFSPGSNLPVRSTPVISEPSTSAFFLLFLLFLLESPFFFSLCLCFFWRLELLGELGPGSIPTDVCLQSIPTELLSRGCCLPTESDVCCPPTESDVFWLSASLGPSDTTTDCSGTSHDPLFESTNEISAWFRLFFFFFGSEVLLVLRNFLFEPANEILSLWSCDFSRDTCLRFGTTSDPVPANMALVSVLPSEELELREKSSERSLDLKNRRCLGSFSTLLVRNCLNICLRRRRRRERDVNHHAYKCTPVHKHTPMINLLFNRARSKQSIDSHLSCLSNPPSSLPGLQKEERKKNTMAGNQIY